MQLTIVSSGICILLSTSELKHGFHARFRMGPVAWLDAAESSGEFLRRWHDCLLNYSIRVRIIANSTRNILTHVVVGVAVWGRRGESAHEPDYNARDGANDSE